MRVQLVQHFVRNSFVFEMLEERAHCRVVREAAILLIEAKVAWMQMYHERRLAALVFAEDVSVVDDYAQLAKPADCV